MVTLTMTPRMMAGFHPLGYPSEVKIGSKIFDIGFAYKQHLNGWNLASFGVSWSKSPLQPPRMMKGKCLNFILRLLVTNSRKFYHQKNVKNVF
jgi:hypothetical protein